MTRIMASTSIFFVLFALINLGDATKTVGNFLCPANQQRLQQVFLDGFKSTDLQSIYYSSINLNSISTADKQGVCKKLAGYYADSKYNDFEKNFYYVATIKQLSCTEKAPAKLLDQLKASFAKDFPTTQEIYYNFFAQLAVDEKFFDEAAKSKLSKNLQGLLKKDDSLTSLGFAFHIASEVGVPASFVYDRVEEVLVQADEVDGKMLQFEGGLSITATLINGVFKVASKFGKPSPVTAEQAVKFTTYFLSRRSVTTPRGASSLLEALKAVTDQKALAPICIRVADNGQLQPEAPVLKIKVSGLLGEALKTKPTAVKVAITGKQSTQKVVEGDLVAVANDQTMYQLDLKSKALPKGVYKVEVVAGEYKQQNLVINVLGKVKLTTLEIGVAETDSQTQTKKSTLEYGKKLTETFQLDHQQKISMKFNLYDEVTNKIISVHQAFVRFYNKENAEIIFIAEQDTSKAYKFEMDVGARSADFGHKSGAYSVDLIVGDSSLVNSFKWTLGEVTLKFLQESKKDGPVAPLRQKRAEIHHLFREPEKRPPRFFSDLFTGLCLAPLLILFILWAKLKINVSNFPISLSVLGFHGGLGAIFALFLCFWLKLDMFQTLKYLMPIALFTFLCGNKLLRAIANRKSDKPEKK